MKRIENIENTDTCGDFVWVHLRGFIFIILAVLSIICTLNMSVYYSVEYQKSNIENIRFCPNCRL